MSKEPSAQGAVIEVLHITDCHLTKEPGGELLGVNTRDSLDAVLNLIKQQHPAPDYLIATGDLAQDGSVEAYQYLQDRLNDWSCLKSWFPGNHDRRANMAAVVAATGELTKVHCIGAWQFVLLDSLVEGKVHGELSAQELALLETALSQRPDLHTLVCLHHHPVSIDSQWLDNIALKNSAEFMAIVAKHSNVKAVLWGHIHQQVDRQLGQLQLMATPSTCIQFLPRSQGFAVDNIAPGYRILRLFADGRIETRVYRADDFEFELDMKSTGY